LLGILNKVPTVFFKVPTGWKPEHCWGWIHPCSLVGSQNWFALGFVWGVVKEACTGHHYWNRAVYRVRRTIGKATKTLGKRFAECRTRQTGLGIGLHVRHSAKRLPSVKDVTRQKKALADEILTVGLPSVNRSTLGKVCTV
jgi:hypothetical protein